MELIHELISAYQEGMQQRPTVMVLFNISVALLVIQILLTSFLPYLQKRLEQNPDYEEAKKVRISINCWMLILLIAICIVGPNQAKNLLLVASSAILLVIAIRA